MAKNPIRSSLEASVATFPEQDRTIILSDLNKLPDTMLLQLEELINREADVEDAYRKIGEQSGQGALGMDTLKEGKRMFNNFRSKLHKDICSYRPLRIYCENANTIDFTTAAGIILGGLAASGTYNLDMVSVAFIVARIGVRGFCRVHWAE